MTMAASLSGCDNLNRVVLLSNQTALQTGLASSGKGLLHATKGPRPAI